MLGFSDHTPWPFTAGYKSQIRMRCDELDGYVGSIASLRESYKNQIEIKIGLECEYYPEYIGWLKEQVDRLNIDYLLFGNHFPYREQGARYFGAISQKSDLTRYVECAQEGMQSGIYNCLAHPELFMRGLVIVDDDCRKAMRDIAVAAKELNVVMEFNTSMEHYPLLWEEVVDVGTKIIVGMDTHNRKELKDPKKYDDAIAKLQGMGANLTYQL